MTYLDLSWYQHRLHCEACQYSQICQRGVELRMRFFKKGRPIQIEHTQWARENLLGFVETGNRNYEI